MDAGRTLFFTILLLTASNVFMTFAWYGHLRFTHAPVWIAILGSWGIAFFEYCLQVPANRIGFESLTGPQLKILQECITFGVFFIFSWLYLKHKPTKYDYLAFFFILTAVAISLFQPKALHSP